MEISDALKFIRKQKNLNYRDISKIAQIGPNQPSRIENGDVSPTCDTIYRIIDGLALTEEELHKFAHITFDLKFPLEPEPTDPLIDELLRLLNRESRDFKRGLLFALRLYFERGDAITKPLDTKAGHG